MAAMISGSASAAASHSQRRYRPVRRTTSPLVVSQAVLRVKSRRAWGRSVPRTSATSRSGAETMMMMIEQEHFAGRTRAAGRSSGAEHRLQHEARTALLADGIGIELAVLHELAFVIEIGKAPEI